jgi:DNA repair protein RAD7
LPPIATRSGSVVEALNDSTLFESVITKITVITTMSARRGGNRIRGPQSALTDFLAANNISAAQIRNEYERRRGTAQENQTETTANDTIDDEEAVAAAVAVDIIEEEDKKEKSRKRKHSAIENIKKAKASAKKDSKKKRKHDESDDDDDADFTNDIYKKARPAPGQFEHCELCSKRFTVTPYSKEGPEGGLVCTPCGKELGKDAKAEKKSASKPAGKKRRKMESDRLDGLAMGGAKSLQQLCISTVAKHHDELEEFGELPQSVLERLSEIFSKKRVLTSKTLPLFLRPDLDAVVVHEAANLAAQDYHHIFAVVPNVEKIVLANACQLKDAAIEYMLDKCHNLKHLHLYGANLVSDEMWLRAFEQAGQKLEVIKLKWLDATFDDTVVREMIDRCPNLTRLKLKHCRRIGEEALIAISAAEKLEHLSLRMTSEIPTPTLLNLIAKRGPTLRTLSLELFLDADDTVLTAIHDTCKQLSKLRLSPNDTATDRGFEALFTQWSNPPLTSVDFNATRDVDNTNPLGPEDAIGLASSGFIALMAHSGPNLKHLNVASCRHIELSAFLDVFNGAVEYPELEYIDVSFCSRVDNSVIAGIFKSCPALKRLVAFGCFDVREVVVPRNVTLIGVPRAQDAIEQFGVGIDVDEALGRMAEICA